MKRKKIIIIAAVLLVAILVGSGVIFFMRKKGEDKKPPELYEVGGETVPAMVVEQEDVTVYSEETSQEAEGEKDGAQSAVQSGDQEEAESTRTVLASTAYVYENLQDPWQLVDGYVQQLTGESQGFSFVDDTLTKTKAPETPEEDCAFTIAKNAAQEGQALQLQISWNEKTCVVMASLCEGTVKEPEEEKKLSYMEAKDYMCNLPPQSLGLHGSSMNEYVVYVQDGSVLVDGHPCVRMKVYRSNDQTATNEIAGQYFLSVNGKQLYRMTEENGKERIEQLEDIPPASGGI